MLTSKPNSESSLNRWKNMPRLRKPQLATRHLCRKLRI